MGYVDFDYAGDLDDRRSKMGYVFTIARGPIYWKLLVQSIVTMSKIEEEYMVVAKAANDALWLTRIVKELHSDSQSAIYLENNHVYHARTKHIYVRFHKIRELLVSGQY